MYFYNYPKDLFFSVVFKLHKNTQKIYFSLIIPIQFYTCEPCLLYNSALCKAHITKCRKNEVFTLHLCIQFANLYSL